MAKKIMFGLAVALVIAMPLTVHAADGFYSSYNPCGWLTPFQHCNVYGSCYCSFWP
jgi:hypothetical protein